MTRITVLLPVYNAMPHLVHAVESLQQQSLRDFKVLVFDDGSTDGSGAYLESLNDPRFTIIHQQNAGLAETLNRMIPMVETEFIARLDADDVCLPQRLAHQLQFMDAHPDAAVAGTRGGYVMGGKSAASFGIGSRKVTLSYSPPMTRPPYWDPLKDQGILIHSTVIMRTETLRAVGGYPNMVPGQDFALWHNMALAGHKLASMDEMLLLSRVARSGISSSNLTRQYHAWYYTAYRSASIMENREPMSIGQYQETHPLSDDQLALLRSKALLRNSLADILSGRIIRGSAGLARVMFCNPKLFLEKIRCRTGSA